MIDIIFKKTYKRTNKINRARDDNKNLNSIIIFLI